MERGKPGHQHAQRAQLDREFASSKTMTVEQYNSRVEALAKQPDIELPAPDHPDIFVTMASVRSSLESVAATIAPLLARVAALEKQQMQFRNSAASGAGLSINAASIDIDLSSLANSITMLNEKLSQPVAPVYDAKGILIGARRVPRLDS